VLAVRRNGRNGNVMDEGLKKSRIVEAIKNGIDGFLSENSDMVGFAHVEYIILSNDLRSCLVGIAPLEAKASKAMLDFLEANHYHINRELKKRFSSKYFPRIKFEVVTDEKIDI